MSEFSMMTQGVPWPLAYGGFTAGLLMLGVATYFGLHYLEQRKVRLSAAKVGVGGTA
jgi:magnesium transporter